MDPVFILLCLFPVAAAVIQLIVWPNTFSWREAAVQGVFCLLFVMGTWGLLRHVNAMDTEIWNGSVSNKLAIRENCPSGWVRSTDSHCTNYSTRSVKTGEICTTDSEGRRTCTPIYTTEYEYHYPWERRFWVVASNIDLKLEYRRVDSQGVNTPPLFAAIEIGDPASKTNSYLNWVKGAATSLFHEDGAIEEKYAGAIPSYPISIYDYLKVDRVISMGVPLQTKVWSADLSRSLSTLGPAKQMNAIAVIVDANIYSEEYPLAVRRAWQGFKKNDAVVFVGVDPADRSVRWSRVLSWSSTSIFDVGLQNAIADLRGRPLTSATLNALLVQHALESFSRRSMDEFEYLKESVPVPGWLYALIALLSLGGTAGISYAFHRNDF